MRLDEHELVGAASIIAGGIAGQYASTPSDDAKVAVRAVSIARNIERHVTESRTFDPHENDSYPAGSAVRVWARPFATYGENRNGLICVELPPNCSIDGDHGTMHAMIAELYAMAAATARTATFTDPAFANRLDEIREWLAENPL